MHYSKGPAAAELRKSIRAKLDGLYGRDKIERTLALHQSGYDPSTGLLWGGKESPGHTAAARRACRRHDGRDSSRWLLFRSLMEGVFPESGQTIQALLSLQDAVPESGTYGCSRWYYEEEQISDTNAAFFISQLLVLYWLLFEDKLDTASRQSLQGYFGRAAHWFRRECREPALFYPNKIISDGSVALALGGILEDRSLTAVAEDFLARWCCYTETCGWGWGEIMSLSYSAIILNALLLIRSVVSREDLLKQISRLTEEILENLRFHAGTILMPAIRTYHFEGESPAPGTVYGVLGLAETGETVTEEWLTAVLLEMAGVHPRENSDGSKKRVRVQRLFDACHATSYKSAHGRLGTINRFPVMPECYQHETWGLGWQSMPAGFVAGKNFGYLQWQTGLAQGEIRSHPAVSFLAGYAAPALFRERIFPEVTTLCRQSEHAAIVIRSMRKVANECGALYDQWRLPVFAGECWADEMVEPGSKAATSGWSLLFWPGICLAIRPLSSLPYAAAAHAPGNVRISWEGNALLLQQQLYEGELQRLEQERIESGWVVLLLDPCPGVSQAREAIAEYKIGEAWSADGTVPRPNAMQIRQVTLAGPGCDLALRWDPYSALPPGGNSL